MFEGIPVDIGLVYEGERIRKANMFAEFAGPKSKGAELLKIVDKSEVSDGKVTVIGMDVDKMEEGKTYPFSLYVKLAGEKLEEDLEGVFERKVHYYLNYIQGFMHLNSRDTVWLRISKEAKEKGLKLEHIGKALIELFKKEYDVVEKADVVIYTDENEVDKFIEFARENYMRRDEKARGLREEDVDVFYGCVLCQSFAPEHMCTITPERISSCGSISWFDGRAAVKIDPEGGLIEVPKGELIDPERGEYTGVDEATNKKSQGKVDKVYLHSIFGHPHTACGCFEAIAFYIPEVDGIGVVHRNYKGNTPLGLPFSTIAGQIGGGQQNDGFVGIAIEYMRSPKFFKADGGWERLVWAPKDVLEQVSDAIPEHLKGKIATEEDACDIDSLKAFLKEKQHPVVQRWKEEPKIEVAQQAEPRAEHGEGISVPEIQLPADIAGAKIQSLPVSGGITIILKNAKIYAEKVIIKRK